MEQFIKGMALCRDFFNDCAKTVIEYRFPDLNQIKPYECCVFCTKIHMHHIANGLELLDKSGREINFSLPLFLTFL